MTCLVFPYALQVAWKPDGTQLLTASGDKTCKLWDVETRSVITEFVMGSQVEDQQVNSNIKGLS
jgi:WD40 repeat protein